MKGEGHLAAASSGHHKIAGLGREPDFQGDENRGMGGSTVSPLLSPALLPVVKLRLLRSFYSNNINNSNDHDNGKKKYIDIYIYRERYIYI